MRTITAILTDLADFAIPAAAVQTRLEALQPSLDSRDSLDLEAFLGAQ